MANGDVLVASVFSPAHDDGVVHTKIYFDASKGLNGIQVVLGLLVSRCPQAMDSLWIQPCGTSFSEKLKLGCQGLDLVIAAFLIVAKGEGHHCHHQNEQEQQNVLENDGVEKS